MKIYFVLGNVGVGKSTFCRQQTDYTHIALGDLLRKEAEDNIVIQNCMEIGKLIPSELTINILKEALDNCNSDCLIDGYPRNFENVRLWNEKIALEPDGIIYIDCPENVCLQRLLNRRRGDDTEVCITNRFMSFRTETLPVIKYYQSRNVVIYNARNFPKSCI